ncbi:MAG: prolyl oligopeptidase family serine peptidase, partial [Cyclobacteriaceae bacterium]|nr:prolyl oligopeptidase family serine peptidase [Cyclobacteriaceae bacterium]
MAKIIKYSFAGFILLLVSCVSEKETAEVDQYTPPIAEKKDSVLDIHGDVRKDAYFWMRLTDEQKNAATPDAQTQKVVDYLNAENEYINNVLAPTDSLQEKLYEEIVGRIKQTDESVPYFKNGYWYYSRFEDGGQYRIYCRKKGNMEAEEEVMLNVNDLAEGHTYFSATGLQVSTNNKILAYGIDTLSRRIYTIHFKNLETGEMYSDQLINTSGGGAWANDNATYFYTTKNEVSLLSEKIWKHKLGGNQDELMYEEKDASFYIGVTKSKSDKYVVIWNNSTTISDYHVLDADTPDEPFKQFTPREANHEYSIEHFEDKFYVVTNWDAMNFKLMEVGLDNTSKENWKEVIPHRDSVLLNSIDVFKNYLVIRERSNALTHLKIINQTTKDEHYLKFDEEAYVVYSSTNPEFDTETLRYGYSSLTTPNSIYDYNMNTREQSLKKQDEVVGGHNPDDYTTERFFVNVRDGADVPVTVVYKNGFDKNGNRPLLLYSYGSYGSSTDPWFRSDRLSLLDRGFAFAIAHIRGGQEMGRQWYEDGKMFKKINTFNDYIDCSKYLIEEKYTSSEHLYAMGGSAGG